MEKDEGRKYAEIERKCRQRLWIIRGGMALALTVLVLCILAESWLIASTNAFAFYVLAVQHDTYSAAAREHKQNEPGTDRY